MKKSILFLVVGVALLMGCATTNNDSPRGGEEGHKEKEVAGVVSYGDITRNDCFVVEGGSFFNVEYPSEVDRSPLPETYKTREAVLKEVARELTKQGVQVYPLCNISSRKLQLLLHVGYTPEAYYVLWFRLEKLKIKAEVKNTADDRLLLVSRRGWRKGKLYDGSVVEMTSKSTVEDIVGEIKK